MTLTGTSGFTGALNVNAGTLALSGGALLGTPTINLGGGTFNVGSLTSPYTASSTTLTGNGTVIGNVSHVGSSLTPGAVGTQGTITFANNYSDNAGTMNIDLSTPGGNTLGGATGNDLVNVLGQLSLTGNTTVNFNFTKVPSIGTYSFLQAATKAGTGTLITGNFGLRPEASVSLDFSGAIAKLVVNSISSAEYHMGSGRFEYSGVGFVDDHQLDAGQWHA